MNYYQRYTESDYISMFEELGFTLPKGHTGMVSCPCHTDKHPSMSVNLTIGIFNCFSCGFHGKIDKVYREKVGKPFEKGVELSNVSLKKYFDTIKHPPIVPAKKELFSATFEVYKDSTLRDWLAYRGISERVANVAKAFYGAVNITYKNDNGVEKSYTVHDRVVFPIYNAKHQLSSLEMRFPFKGNESATFKDSVKKVLYPKNSSVNFLYDIENLDRSSKLYVAEGLMDCLAFRSLTGIKNSTSIFGAQLTAYQKELLNEFSEVCYVYNNDTAGLKSLQSMKDSYKGKFSELKPADDWKDVGEMTMHKFKEVDKWLKMEKY